MRATAVARRRGTRQCRRACHTARCALCGRVRTQGLAQPPLLAQRCVGRGAYRPKPLGVMPLCEGGEVWNWTLRASHRLRGTAERRASCRSRRANTWSCEAAGWRVSVEAIRSRLGMGGAHIGGGRATLHGGAFQICIAAHFQACHLWRGRRHGGGVWLRSRLDAAAAAGGNRRQQRRIWIGFGCFCAREPTGGERWESSRFCSLRTFLPRGLARRLPHWGCDVWAGREFGTEEDAQEPWRAPFPPSDARRYALDNAG
jgi:hypothetical protein